MVSYMRGTLLFHEEDRIVVLVGGLGLDVFIPARQMERLPGIGEEIILHTYLAVKEDALTLYGFSSRQELELFKRLITVSGVGPKGALAMLSAISAEELVFAIYSGDAKKIATANGIGKRTAERVILDLRDKLPSPGEAGEFDRDDIMDADEPATMKGEAIQALVSLGYGRAESTAAVRKVQSECTTVEELLKEALKYIF